MAADVPEGWNALEDDFFYIELRPPGKGGDDVRFDPPYATFLVSVDSRTDLGRLWHNDPLAVLIQADDDQRRRGEDPVFGVPPDREGVQVLSFRVNAELPVNPRLHSAVVNKYPGSTIFAIVHFKDLGER